VMRSSRLKPSVVVSTTCMELLVTTSGLKPSG
jgi:hypothetical protein